MMKLRKNKNAGTNRVSGKSVEELKQLDYTELDKDELVEYIEKVYPNR
jgi:hypothetical protein